MLLIIANVVWFLYMEIHGDINTNEGMLSCGAMLSDAIEKGNYSQLITAIFVHFDIQHIAEQYAVTSQLWGQCLNVIWPV